MDSLFGWAESSAVKDMAACDFAMCDKCINGKNGADACDAPWQGTLHTGDVCKDYQVSDPRYFPNGVVKPAVKYACPECKKEFVTKDALHAHQDVGGCQDSSEPTTNFFNEYDPPVCDCGGMAGHAHECGY